MSTAAVVPEVDLTGAVDMHVHFGPDPGRTRRTNALEAADQAAAAGHAGIVLKSHDTPTANVAALCATVSSIPVFGSICCDLPVGGMNPWAVENALEIGAKVVWLPTMTSVEDWPTHREHHRAPGPGVRVTEDGRLTPEAEEVLRLVVEHDAVVASGHISIEEHLAVAAAMPPGGKFLVTHGLETLCGPRRSMTTELLEELVGRGAVVEFCAMTCTGAFATRPTEEIAAAMTRLGPDACTVASDFGQEANDLPTVGLARFAAELVRCGIDEAAVRRMAVDNPQRLVGLAT